MSVFYIAAKSLEKAQALTERHGPDAWFGARAHAYWHAASGEKVFKVTIDVTEDA